MKNYKENISKIKKFAKENSLSIKLVNCPDSGKCSGEADLISGKITIFKRKSVSREDIVWTLVHEISHILESRKCYKRKKKFIKALIKSNEQECPASFKIVSRYEIEDIKKMKSLVKEIGIDVDRRNLNYWIEFDIETYRYFRIHGKFMSRKDRKFLVDIIQIKNGLK